MENVDQIIHTLNTAIMISPTQAKQAAQTIQQLKEQNEFLQNHIKWKYPHHQWDQQQTNNYLQQLAKHLKT